MGALSIACSKKGKNVAPRVIRMLKELRHRGSEGHGIATANSVEITSSIQEIEKRCLLSDVAIGYNFSRILPADSPQPIEDPSIKLIFEGRFFPPIPKNEVQEILRKGGGNPEEKAEYILKMDGSYTFAILGDHRLIVGRDPIGLAPLHFGEDDEAYSFASERKALWAVGIRNLRSFPPGNLAVIDDEKVLFKPVKTIFKPAIRPISMDEATNRLYSLLMESIRERIMGIKEVALAFSGGLDSSIIASLVKDCDVEIHLINVGMENQTELQHAEDVAAFLGLPLHVKTFNAEDVEEALPVVLWLVEEPDALKVSVAMPLYWTAEVAREMGVRILLTGQGGDELFGGYHRYLREYVHSGLKGLEDALYRDITISHEVNFERDNKVCAFHNVELRLPFVDYDLTLFALSLPIDLKISSERDYLRKRVLRELSKKIGLPPNVYNMRKRAIQYSTGVDRTLRKIARREGLSLDNFLKRSFLKILQERKMES